MFPWWLSGLRTQGLCEDVGSIPDLAPWVEELALLQALIRPLAQELPDAIGVALKKGKGI